METITIGQLVVEVELKMVLLLAETVVLVAVVEEELTLVEQLLQVLVVELLRMLEVMVF
jgi:hypothetical protein